MGIDYGEKEMMNLKNRIEELEHENQKLKWVIQALTEIINQKEQQAAAETSEGGGSPDPLHPIAMH